MNVWLLKFTDEEGHEHWPNNVYVFGRHPDKRDLYEFFYAPERTGLREYFDKPYTSIVDICQKLVGPAGYARVEGNEVELIEVDLL